MASDKTGPEAEPSRLWLKIRNSITQKVFSKYADLVSQFLLFSPQVFNCDESLPIRAKDVSMCLCRCITYGHLLFCFL